MPGARDGDLRAVADISRGRLVQHVDCCRSGNADVPANGDTRDDRDNVLARPGLDRDGACCTDLAVVVDIGLRVRAVHQRGIRHADAGRAADAHRAGDHRGLEGARGLDVDRAAGVDHRVVADMGLGDRLDVGNRNRGGDACAVPDAGRGRDRQHRLGGVGRHLDGSARVDQGAVANVGIGVLEQQLDVQADAHARAAGGDGQRTGDAGDGSLIDCRHGDGLGWRGGITARANRQLVDLAAGTDVRVGIQVEDIDDERTRDSNIAGGRRPGNGDRGRRGLGRIRYERQIELGRNEMVLGVDRERASRVCAAGNVGRGRGVHHIDQDGRAERRALRERAGRCQGLRVEIGPGLDVDPAAGLELRAAARRCLGVKRFDHIDADRTGDRQLALAACRCGAPSDEIVGLGVRCDRADCDAVTPNYRAGVHVGLVAGIEYDVQADTRCDIGVVVHRDGGTDGSGVGVVFRLCLDRHGALRRHVAPIRDAGGVLRFDHVDRDCGCDAHAAVVLAALGRRRSLPATGLVFCRRQRSAATIGALGGGVVVDLVIGLAVSSALTAAAVLFRVVLVLALHRRGGLRDARHGGRRRQGESATAAADVARQLGADVLGDDRDRNRRTNPDTAARRFGAGSGLETAGVHRCD